MSFSATTHRPAADLASKLKRMQKVWYEVGGSFQGETWAGGRAKKKDVKTLLQTNVLLSLLGSWGRCENWRHQMVITSHPDDVPWSGEVSTKPTPNSEMTATGYIFHDISWKQKILNLGSFLSLNLIGRSQERLQVARGLLVIQRCTELKRVLNIQMDGIYLQPPKREFKKL